MGNYFEKHSPNQGAVTMTFFRFVIPSILSLLAISTASLVDGFFVGNYIGVEALASITLLIPYFSLLFAIALMLAIGGSVRASIYIEKNDYARASNVFSLIFFVAFTINLVVIPISLIFSEELFYFLGGSPELFPLMQEYFDIFCVVMLVKLSCLVLYYFIRADNQPELGMKALIIGASTNVIFDALFICVFDWGIGGAAWAGFLAEMVQLLCILRYFRLGKNNLYFIRPKNGWSELKRSACNGFSEFINESSVAIVIFVFHWVINQQAQFEGVAAFSIVNYIIYISLMIYYGIVDGMHVLFSQSLSAGLTRRVEAFMKLAGAFIALLSVMFVVFLHVFRMEIIGFFLDDGSDQVFLLSEKLVYMIWPAFLFNGFNILICAYLTAAEKALHSSVIALSRSLILPIIFIVGLSFLLPGMGFIYAIPMTEGLTCVLALMIFFKYRPSVLIPGNRGGLQGKV